MSLATVAAKKKFQESNVKLLAFGNRLIIRLHAEAIDKHAFGDGVELRKDGDHVRTKAGLYTPETVKEQAIRRALTGTVIAKGDACEWDIEVGDDVFFGPHTGFMIEDEIGGYERCIIACEDDILCKVEGS